MARKMYSLEVKGNWKSWSFPIWAEPEHVEDWRRDGLVVYDLLASNLPGWVVRFGLEDIWALLQRLGLIPL